jgi:DNA polymerase (family 10)
MMEIDILPDGKLAVPDEGFNYLDAAIVSIHSSFHVDKENMTKRVLNGLSHPKAKIFAHPTGRLIGSREGYELDWNKLFAFCQENDKAIEINAYPDRLDLPDTLVRQAIRQGVKLIIDTDSHEAAQMSLMRYGVSVARRGWASVRDIVNTLPYNKFRDWLLKRG